MDGCPASRLEEGEGEQRPREGKRVVVFLDVLGVDDARVEDGTATEPNVGCAATVADVVLSTVPDDFGCAWSVRVGDNCVATVRVRCEVWVATVAELVWWELACGISGPSRLMM